MSGSRASGKGRPRRTGDARADQVRVTGARTDQVRTRGAGTSHARAHSAQGPPLLSSRRHPLVQEIRKLAQRPQLGERSGLFLVDGIHLLEEALASPYRPEAILCGPRLQRIPNGRALLQKMRARDWPLREVTEDLLSYLSTTQTAQGAVGLFRRPPSAPLPQPEEEGLAALVLAGLQDPLNLGSLARTARVFGCPRLIALAETVDPLHPRALRASSGWLLRMEIHRRVSVGDLGEWIAAHGVRAVALVPHGGARIDGIAPAAKPLAIVLGSEGAGLSTEVAALCTERWTIPMIEGADSLGVAAAGAIALFAAHQSGSRAGASQDSR
ncbi:MAG: RNA methyltransferase [Candidatus Eisenbacteria bacterium]|nr:RNA methyltransferase [Candidatus Eisenbacteria bacterium]